MVFQQPNPFPMSIFDNVAFALREQSRKRPGRRELEPLVIDALRRAGLYDEVRDDLDRPALRLSGGQQQRLCIARAIAPRPEVLLMDEPCSALDPISTGVIEELIGELRRDLAVVIVTHNLAQAHRVADKVAFMYLGDLVEYGTDRRRSSRTRAPSARANTSAERSDEHARARSSAEHAAGRRRRAHAARARARRLRRAQRRPRRVREHRAGKREDRARKRLGDAGRAAGRPPRARCRTLAQPPHAAPPRARIERVMTSLAPVPSESTTCANCSAPLVADQRYCLSCGQPCSPVRLAFLDVLESERQPQLGAGGVGTMPVVAYTPYLEPAGRPGWLRRYAPLFAVALGAAAGDDRRPARRPLGDAEQQPARARRSIKVEGLGGRARRGRGDEHDAHERTTPAATQQVRRRSAKSEEEKEAAEAKAEEKAEEEAARKRRRRKN